MRAKRREMIQRLCVVGLLGALVPLASAQYDNESDCDQGGRGYTRVDELNADILAERARIEGGADPLDNYSYVLCPNTSFDTSTAPIVPALENMVIGCGENLSSANTCVLVGGGNQIRINSFANSDYPVTSVVLQGITFTDFSEAAVTGPLANDSTTVTLEDVIFEPTNQPGAFLINQSSATPNGAPFNVQVRNSVIDGGTISEGFKNEGGELTISGLSVDDATMGALISAESGTVIVGDLSVAGGSLGNVVSLQDGARATVNEMSITTVADITEIVIIDGAGTSAVITNANVANIARPDSAENAWRGFVATNGATMSVSDSTIQDTEGARVLFNSISGSEITVQRVDVINSVGVQALDAQAVSAVAEANGASITYSDSLITGISDYTSALLMAFGSTLDATGNCLSGTEADAVIFITKDSTFTVSNNAIENMQSLACQDSGVGGADGTGRLAQELPDANCFDAGGGGCEVECFAFAEYETCQEIVESTIAPTSTPSTSAPTVRVSDAPSSVPTNSPAPTPLTQPPTTLTAFPTLVPTIVPTSGPTSAPTSRPTMGQEFTVPPVTAGPTLANMTAAPTGVNDTATPTVSPTMANTTTAPTPTLIPEDTEAPSGMPSQLPTIQETPSPTATPAPTPLTRFPTTPPTSTPTANPTLTPTSEPTGSPTITQTPTITRHPTGSPTSSSSPTAAPTMAPTTQNPTSSPSGPPVTLDPTNSPNLQPTSSPTLSPVDTPTISPTKCIPRPIYVSVKNPPGESSSKSGKGKGSDMSSKGKGKGSRYLMSMHRSNKGKGHHGGSSKGKGHHGGSNKGHHHGGYYGHAHEHKHHRPTNAPSPPPEDADLPYCDDVFRPVYVTKGKGKGKGSRRTQAVPAREYNPRNLRR